MTALTYQKDARAYRFSLPNEIWGLKLPPPAFSILAYLCYLNSHHKGDAVPSVDEIAALLHMSPDMAEKQLDTGLTKRRSRDMQRLSMLWENYISLMMPASMIPSLESSGWNTPPTTETTMHPTVWARNI